MIYTLSLDYDTICQKPFGKTFPEFTRATLLCLVRGFISLHVPLFSRVLLHRENLFNFRTSGGTACNKNHAI